MKNNKIFGVGLFFALGVFLLGLVPVKASAQYYGGGDMQYPVSNYSTLGMTNYYGNSNYMPYRSNYFPGNSYNNYYPGNIYSQVTFPRTVYLVDAGNSANQLNIINATREGTTTAAYVTVPTYVYNRVVNDYNVLGVVSISVDPVSNIVTFQTVSGTFSDRAILISFQ